MQIVKFVGNCRHPVVIKRRLYKLPSGVRVTRLRWPGRELLRAMQNRFRFGWQMFVEAVIDGVDVD